jgi:acetyl esterase
MSQYPIQPDTAALLKNLAAQGGPKLSEMPLLEARAAVRSLTQYCDLPCTTHCITRDLATSGELPVPVRLYSPQADTTGPVIVFVHGGGFVLGDPDAYDAFIRYLSIRTGLRVVAVNYRLAPEFPFPAAFEDVNRTISWVLSNPMELGAAVDAVALAGDSAGGALIACCTAESQGSIQALLMLYPVADLAARSTSYHSFREGYLLEAADMEYFIRSYTPNERDRSDPRASPALIDDLSQFPPTTLLTCGLDVLRDEGRTFASRLVAAGIETHYREARGQIHGIATLRGAIPSARAVLDEVIDNFLHQITRPCSSSTAEP